MAALGAAAVLVPTAAAAAAATGAGVTDQRAATIDHLNCTAVTLFIEIDQREFAW
jgi:hypothetical protein